MSVTDEPFPGLPARKAFWLLPVKVVRENRAMGSGWIALTSGLGGVLITSAVAYLAPLRLQRRKAEADLALEARRDQVSREADVAARAAAREAADAESVDALIAKVIEVRVAMALALETYKDVIQDLQAGRPVDYASFRRKARKRAERIHEASAGLMASRVFMQSGGYGDRPVGTTPIQQPPERLEFLDQLDDLLHTVETVIRIRGGPERAEALGVMLGSSLDSGLRQAALARQNSLQRLFREIEQRHGVQIPHLVPDDVDGREGGAP